MYNFSARNTIKALTLLELPDDKEITSEMIKSNFRKLCLIYHPDQANDRYKDGEKFCQLKEAQEYLLANLSAINEQIGSGFQEKSSYSSEAEERHRTEEARKAEEARQRKAEEVRRAEEKRRAEAARRAEDARKRNEDARKAEEAQYRADAARKTEEARRAEAQRMVEEILEEKKRKAAVRRNRIIFAILIVLVLAAPLILIGNSRNTNSNASKNTLTDEKSTISGTQTTSQSTVPTIKVKNSVIYNGNGVTITAKGIEKASNGWKVKLLIDNHSELNLGFNAHAYAINGIMTRNNIYDMACDVAAGKVANTYLLLKDSVIDSYGIKDIRCVDILFWAYDNDKSFKAFDTNQIEIKTELYNEKHDAFQGETLYNEKGIKVDYMGEKEDYFVYCITNTTGTYFDFDLSEITINNFTCSDIDFDLIDEMVLNDCQIVIVVNVNNKFKTENSIDQIRSIEWNMKIRPAGSYFNDYKIGPIVYKVS